MNHSTLVSLQWTSALIKFARFHPSPACRIEHDATCTVRQRPHTIQYRPEFFPSSRIAVSHEVDLAIGHLAAMSFRRDTRAPAFLHLPLHTHAGVIHSRPDRPLTELLSTKTDLRFSCSLSLILSSALTSTALYVKSHGPYFCFCFCFVPIPVLLAAPRSPCRHLLRHSGMAPK